MQTISIYTSVLSSFSIIQHTYSLQIAYIFRSFYPSSAKMGHIILPHFRLRVDGVVHRCNGSCCLLVIGHTSWLKRNTECSEQLLSLFSEDDFGAQVGCIQVSWLGKRKFLLNANSTLSWTFFHVLVQASPLLLLVCDCDFVLSMISLYLFPSSFCYGTFT